MAGSNVLVIARKEFLDLLLGRRFLLLLGILLAVCVVGLVGGVGEYNATLDNYNARQSAADTSAVIPGLVNEPPSVMLVFEKLASPLALVLAILGIATGFDLIAREKEAHSLKQLLAAPVFRDQVINGKALGGMAALVLALTLAFACAIAVLLVSGIVPSADELGRILLYVAGGLLLIAAFFSCALAASAVANESGTALVATLIVFTVLSLLVPVTVSDTVMGVIAGEAPQPPITLTNPQPVQGTGNSTAAGVVIYRGEQDLSSPEWKRFQAEMQVYSEKQRTVQDISTLLSPGMNFEAIANGLAGNENLATFSSPAANRGGFVTTVKSSAAGAGTEDRAAGVAMNFLALLIFPAVCFGIAYTRFMRIDVR
ncbi:MAG: ABC transporter permease [Methanospirillum sp.]